MFVVQYNFLLGQRGSDVWIFGPHDGKLNWFDAKFYLNHLHGT